MTDVLETERLVLRTLMLFAAARVKRNDPENWKSPGRWSEAKLVSFGCYGNLALVVSHRFLDASFVLRFCPGKLHVQGG